MAISTKRKKKKRRVVVLGEGHPWFLGNDYTSVCLSKRDASTPKDGEVIPLKMGGLGAWKKVRLICEVIE